MASPTFRAKSSIVTVPSTGNGSIAVSKPTGTVDDDYVFIFVAHGNSGAGSTMAAPSGFTELAFLNPGAFAAGYRVFGKLASSEPSSWSIEETAAGNAAQGRAFAASWSGVNTSTPLDDSATASSTNTATPAFPTVTAEAADTTLVAWVFENNGRTCTFTEAGSMTEREDSGIGGYSFGVFEEEIASSGSVSGRTCSASLTGDFVRASFLLASAGGAAPALPSLRGSKLLIPKLLRSSLVR
jgi:hypothetical protein